MMNKKQLAHEASDLSGSCVGGSLRALVQEGGGVGLDAEGGEGLIHLVVAGASKIPGNLNVVTELSIIAELLGGEVEGEDELPGLIEESDGGALHGVEALELVGGQLGGTEEEHELEAESEEGGVLAGPLLGLVDVGGGAGVVDTDALAGAR